MIAMLYDDIFYMTLNEKKCFDVQYLPQKDPIRLYIEQNFYPVSYSVLDKERDDICEEYNIYSPYYDNPIFDDIDNREDILDQRHELRVNDDEYKEIEYAIKM